MDNFAVHPTDDQFEAFRFRRLAGPELDNLEDHLLLCELCRQRMYEVDVGVYRLKESTSWAREKEFFRSGQPTVWRRFQGLLLAWPVWGAAAVTAAIAVVLVLPAPRQAQLAYQEVALQSMRGVASSDSARSTSWLRLRLDLQRLQPMDSCYVTLVDAGGRKTWESGKLRPRDGTLLVELDRKLARGAYWVRLTARPGGEQTLREYPLKVE